MMHHVLITTCSLTHYRVVPVHHDVARRVEPFVGGAAVSLDIGTPALVSDMNPSLINLYKVVGSSAYGQLQSLIDGYKLLTGEYLEEAFYAARDVINNPQDELVWAASFIMVRQQCFSGMERYNKSGKFNVPWGRYKGFKCNLSTDHHEFFKHSDIRLQDAVEVIAEATPSDFIFLDPPYLDRLGYIDGDGSDGLHTRLADALSKTSAPFLLIHSDCSFYRDAYSGFTVDEKAFKYSQQFKGREMKQNNVVHLYVHNR